MLQLRSTMSFACIVTGKLTGDLSALARALAGFEVFVCTYPAFAAQALQLAGTAANVVFVRTVPNTIPKEGARQWYLLQTAVQRFSDQLKTYSVVMRARCGCTFASGRPLRSMMQMVVPGCMHMLSDNIFYSTATHFVSCCRAVYTEFCRTGYYLARSETRLILPHWRHLQCSAFVHGRNKYPTRWYFLMFPKEQFADVQRHNCGAMMERLRAVWSQLPQAGNFDDFQTLARLDLRPGADFDSEAAFLHHCLRFGPVHPTGLEDVALLRDWVGS